MTLLTIIQDASDLVGIARPATGAASTDSQARTLCAHARFTLEEMARRWDWQQLVNPEGSITLATGDQDYALASDFLRMRHDTLWDRTDNQIQDFPIDGQEWAFLKGDDLTTTSNRRARIFGNLVNFYDAITAADNNNAIKYEYISSNLALNGSTPVANLTVDAYTARLPEFLVTLGVVYRWRQGTGKPWQADFDKWKSECERAVGQAGVGRVLSMNAAGDGGLNSGVIVNRDYG